MKKKSSKKYKSKQWRNLSVFLFLLFVGFVVYSPSLGGSFLFDDFNLLSDAKRLKTIPYYFETLKTSKRFFSNRHSYTFWMLFLTEYRIFGENPLGYKLVNLFFHILASFVFFLFLKRILIAKFSNTKDIQAFSYYFSFFGALLFLVHPVNTEAVSYIAGMNNGIGGFFFILGGWFFVLSLEKQELKEKFLFGMASLFSFIVSFFFKEVYFVFPVFMIFLYLFLKPVNKKRIIVASVSFFVWAGITILAAFYLNISPFPKIKLTMLKYISRFEFKAVATNLYAVVYSFFLNIFPKNLNLDHDLPLIYSIFNWKAVFALVVILALLFVFYRFRKKLPLSLFAYLSYLLLMAPSNSFILRGMEKPGYDILSERNLYAPSFFFVIIALELMWEFSGRNFKKFKTIALMVIVLFGLRTFARNFDFKDDLTIWKASLKYSPDKLRPNYNYAIALKNVGRINEAIPYAKKAFLLSPGADTIGLLANLYKRSGKTESYMALLESALEKKEFQSAVLYHEFGEYFYQKGEFRRAEKYLKEAIRKRPVFVLPRISLVYLYLNTGKLALAKKHLKVLERLIGKNKYRVVAGVYIDDVIMARVSFAKGLYLFATGKEEKGVEKCLEAIKLNPKFTEPYLKLGEYYYLNNKDDKALFYLEKAKSTPDYFKYEKQADGMIKNILQANRK